MKFFPSEKFEIETAMTKEEVVERLKSVTDADRFWKWHWSLKPYMGEVNEESFRIIEALAGKRSLFISNGFFCEIYGSFKNTDLGTIISAEVRLNRLAKVFMIIWFVGVAAAFFSTLQSYLSSQKSPFYIVFAPVGFFILGFLVMNLLFWFDARSVKPGLIKVFGKQ